MTTKDEDIWERSRLLADMAYYQRKYEETKSEGWHSLAGYAKETALFLSDKIKNYDYTEDEDRIKRANDLLAKLNHE
jgi:hypothetical protein